MINSLIQHVSYLAVFSVLFCSLPVFATQDERALIKRGEEIAQAADCIACHRTLDKNGPPFAGGYIIASPMGDVVASNITPSKQYGIGNYSEQQFANVLRKGINADGKYLYPIMPYTAFQGITDADIYALYTYLQQGVKPIDKMVVASNLSFPFNIRPLMSIWNLLFLDNSTSKLSTNLNQQMSRGQYLVDNLAHCGTCHTPRNWLMAEDNRQYLAGAIINGWFAPNITSDYISGIGSWSEAEIVQFLQTGHLANKAQAAGGMAEAVEYSFRYLSVRDLQAMAAYLKTVAPIRLSGQQLPADATHQTPTIDMSKLEIGQGDQATLADSSTTDGAVLYNATCASCHGRDGKGTEDFFYPSLLQNTAVGGMQTNNLVMSILEGVHRQGADLTVSMPAFADQLNNHQIAAVASYVTQTFGNSNLYVTTEEVANLRQGGEKPLLLVLVPYFIGLAVLLFVVITVVLVRRKKVR